MLCISLTSNPDFLSQIPYKICLYILTWLLGLCWACTERLGFGPCGGLEVAAVLHT